MFDMTPLPILLVALLAFCHVTLSYKIDDSLTFTQMVERIPVAQYFRNATLHHPLHEALAKGTLPLITLKALIQQDHLFSENRLKAFGILAKREMDPNRRKYLQGVARQNYGSAWEELYVQFNFSRGVHMVPPVLEYSVHDLSLAKNGEIAVALASFYPARDIWGHVASRVAAIADLPNNPSHPHFTPIARTSRGQKTAQFVTVLNEYYARLGNDTKTKKKMLHAYTRSIQYELKFAETILALQVESIPAPNFTDLVDSHFTPDAVAGVVNHALYREIGAGTLPLDRFAILMQQDHIYINGFYGAFTAMEDKETDAELKHRLHKNSDNMVNFFKRQYENYDFQEAYFVEKYTLAYVDHIISKSHHSSIPEGLAALYPCYFIWNRMGRYMNKLAQNVIDPHPYGDFVTYNNPAESGSLAKFQGLINTYFDRLEGDLETKLKMFQIVGESVLYEEMFADAVYKLGRPQGL